MLKIVAPNLCYECGKLGTSLCDNCEFDIISEPYSRCISCQRPAMQVGICGSCEVPYTRAWVVSERTDTLEKLLNGYKFEREKASSRVLARLLHRSMPLFDDLDVRFVPIPTISSHIRQRGYDHAALIAKELARLRESTYSPILSRKTSTKQLGSSRSQRIQNAKDAFEINQQLDNRAVYILVDDVFTTGSTLKYAAKALRTAGAGAVWVAVVARQPFDESGSKRNEPTKT